MKIASVRGMKPANAPPGLIYCGRPARTGWKGSPLANPGFETCAQYRTYLEKKIADGNQTILGALLALPADATLGCWCVNLDAPSPDGQETCHCEIIAKLAVQVQNSRHAAHTSVEG